MGKYSFEYLIIVILVLLLGIVLNFLVVAFNGMQMPTSLDYADDCFTLVDTEGNPVEIPSETVVPLPPGRVFMDSNTRLKALGDIIYIENLAFDGYYSAGDILIELGTINLLVWLLIRLFTSAGRIYSSRNHLNNRHAYI
jgi:hypothetical protein